MQDGNQGHFKTLEELNMHSFTQYVLELCLNMHSVKEYVLELSAKSACSASHLSYIKVPNCSSLLRMEGDLSGSGPLQSFQWVLSRTSRLLSRTYRLLSKTSTHRCFFGVCRLQGFFGACRLCVCVFFGVCRLRADAYLMYVCVYV